MENHISVIPQYLLARQRETKKGKKIIGFDLDGVIIDHALLKLRLAAEHGWKLKLEQTPSVIIKNALPPDVLDKLKYSLYSDPKIFLLSPLMPGAKETLIELKKQKIPYALISRRRSPDAAIKLLEARKLWPAYFNEANAFFVSTPEEKNIKAAKLGITHYVDDELNVLKKLACVRHKFLFDPLNAHKNAGRYIKVSLWSELADYFF